MDKSYVKSVADHVKPIQGDEIMKCLVIYLWCKTSSELIHKVETDSSKNAGDEFVRSARRAALRQGQEENRDLKSWSLTSAWDNESQNHHGGHLGADCSGMTVRWVEPQSCLSAARKIKRELQASLHM